MADLTFEDLVDEAGSAAEEAAAETAAGKGTGEWVAETVELLDKRGLLEPILFGPEGAKEVNEAKGGPAGRLSDDAAGGDRDDEGGLDLDAEGIAEAGEAIMAQLGEDVTVAEVVQICRDNPQLVNQQIGEHL